MEINRAGFLAIGLFLALNRYHLLADQIDAVVTLPHLGWG